MAHSAHLEQKKTAEETICSVPKLDSAAKNLSGIQSLASTVIADALPTCTGYLSFLSPVSMTCSKKIKLSTFCKSNIDPQKVRSAAPWTDELHKEAPRAQGGQV